MIALTHGSEDSTDHDRIYVFGDKPSPRECQLFCAQTEENRNLMVLSKEGVVRECFKGLPDEINNSLLRTVPLHTQNCDNPITRRVTRVIPLKAARAVRLLLTRMTRSPYRREIKSALRSGLLRERLEALAGVDFREVPLSIDARKSQAFQLGQTLALMEGDELYTKAELAQRWPALRAILYRDPEADLEVLHPMRDHLVDRLGSMSLLQDGPLLLMHSTARRDALERQARGMVLNLKTERVVAWPLDAPDALVSLFLGVEGTKRVVGRHQWSVGGKKSLLEACDEVHRDMLSEYTVCLQDDEATKIVGARNLWTGDVVGAHQVL